jgi:hypothetical protein
MKKIATSKTPSMVREDLLPEYNFDYRKAKPNRFADRKEEDRVVVVLDPDVSKVFRTPDSVNMVLRALIETMPSKPKRKKVSA